MKSASAKDEPQRRSFAGLRAALRWVLAVLFVVAGIAHLAVPKPFIAITPDWVPFAPQVIFVTGLCELAGAAALVANDVWNLLSSANRQGRFATMLGSLRWSAGVAFALYALCVWPANIKQALDHIVIAPLPDSWWYHGPRLALQPVIIWAALFAAGVTDWPFSRLRRGGPPA